MEHLVHIAPEALSTWRAQLGPRLITLSEPLSPGFRLARFNAPPAPHALCRYSSPVEDTRRFARRRDLDLEAESRRLLARFGDRVRHAQCVGLRHGLRPLAARLEARIHDAQRGTSGWFPDAEEAPPDAPGLVAVLTDGRLIAGCVTPREAGDVSACNRRAQRWLKDARGAVSRAGVKWRESAARLRLLGVEVEATRRWVELGAAPGGITSEVSRIAEVIAVDLAPLAPEIAARSGVTAIRADASTVTIHHSFDGIICDINGPPSRALAAVTRLCERLPPGGLVVHTLKLPRWSLLSQLEAKTIAELARVGIETLMVQHLVSHRQEVVVMGHKTAP